MFVDFNGHFRCAYVTDQWRLQKYVWKDGWVAVGNTGHLSNLPQAMI